ncbi:uncharacterized protein L969DRAFT_87163 [Mixia osmundae IAM 14324]|uniref:uncharacterized protein n=1 Tax=Mixia osmundae (strain CBS 9802 / IAM 14324 / JCM 22182 / KY 12970) TaxID=764103 RepID=UPI0004A54DBB|nr:uncharacterized protein L969DRAFT_87163 [Mixia osmundae IAM 14324]KEI39218.1 hypothetical protein L969DRAFT_87163 [Mixia osmundae IAM 14324]
MFSLALYTTLLAILPLLACTPLPHGAQWPADDILLQWPSEARNLSRQSLDMIQTESFTGLSWQTTLVLHSTEDCGEQGTFDVDAVRVGMKISAPAWHGIPIGFPKIELDGGDTRAVVLGIQYRFPFYATVSFTVKGLAHLKDPTDKTDNAAKCHDHCAVYSNFQIEAHVGQEWFALIGHSTHLYCIASRSGCDPGQRDNPPFGSTCNTKEWYITTA